MCLVGEIGGRRSGTSIPRAISAEVSFDSLSPLKT